MKETTRVNHPPTVELAADNHSVVAPIYQSVKFEFDSLDETERFFRGERPGFFYTRASNPTTRQLELLLAELQGREECLVCASGVGAISQTLLSLTKQGDHILCFVETYGPTRYLIRRLLARFGVTHTMLSIEDTVGIETALAAHKTRLVMFESPTNPVTKIADIAALTRLARSAGALTVMDNTFAGFHQHGEFEVDLFVHSLTKYASGAGDVMGGAVIASRELIRSMRTDWGTLGGTLDPHAAFLILRGLKTLPLRMARHCENARGVVDYLTDHAQIARVHYPGFGAIVSFEIDASVDDTIDFTKRLRLWTLAESLGGVKSLFCHPPTMTHASVEPEVRRKVGIADGLIRLSVGLEDVHDLIDDLDQALAEVESPRRVACAG